MKEEGYIQTRRIALGREEILGDIRERWGGRIRGSVPSGEILRKEIYEVKTRL